MRAIFEQKSLSFEIFNIDTLTNIETFILSIKMEENTNTVLVRAGIEPAPAT